MHEGPYVASRFQFKRRASRAVKIGAHLQIGGASPIVIQSMCTTPTQDVAATVKQCISLAEVGCQLVRITAPGVKDAIALKDIRREFSAAGFERIPLVADIHFMPPAAMEALLHVEKVRVNPGNFADKKRFAVTEYTDQAYREELERVHERFLPVVHRAKELGRALRIGTNHGSLSDRIMNRFGDTPLGMVESAMEFIVIAESEGFRDLVISMKSSNPKIMVQAYRMLAARLERHGTPYPLHLGVTEAGDGEDGRTKSAAGIGALLEDGIGDTIRVSLTEAPEAEIPVAQALAALYENRREFQAAVSITESIDPYVFNRRVSDIARIASDVPIGGGMIPRVLVPTSAAGPKGQEPKADGFVADSHLWFAQARSIPGAERCQQKSQAAAKALPGQVPLIYMRAHQCAEVGKNAVGALVLARLEDDNAADTLRNLVKNLPDGCVIGIAETNVLGEVRAYRLLAAVIDEEFRSSGHKPPICISLPFQHDDLAIAAIAGSLLLDGIGDCLYFPAAKDPRRLSYTVLQAVKARVTRADYVACPSCGRTQFDLMEVTAHIKEVTAHLNGVTIAIMGCIVNGPGEMADADFGYVGSGPGKIDLYRGKQIVRRNLPFNQARDELVALIKESGFWKDPV
jgi:(E)-4-hydroxy-3-methylbut-2-enyl-diphosphate synthase